MAQKKSTSEGQDWKALVSEEKEFFRVVVQQVLESEKRECLREHAQADLPQEKVELPAERYGCGPAKDLLRP